MVIELIDTGASTVQFPTPPESKIASSPPIGAVVSFAPPEVVDQQLATLKLLPAMQPVRPPRQYFVAADAAPEEKATMQLTKIAIPIRANTPPADLSFRFSRRKMDASRPVHR